MTNFMYCSTLPKCLIILKTPDRIILKLEEYMYFQAVYKLLISLFLSIMINIILIQKKSKTNLNHFNVGSDKLLNNISIENDFFNVKTSDLIE